MTAKTKAPKVPGLTDLAALEEAAECLKTLAHPHPVAAGSSSRRGCCPASE